MLMTERTPDIATAILTSTPTMRPLIANALWTPLRQRNWRRAVRPITTYTTGQRGLRSTTPPIPGPAPRWENIPEEECLWGYMPSTRTRIGKALRVILYRPDHDEVLRSAPALHAREYRRAIHESYCERPFYRAPELASGWRLNFNEPLLTARVGSVLEELAAAAHVELLTPEVEGALLTQD